VKNETMNRRQFLQSGLMAATLASAGRLPLLAVETAVDSGIDAATGPYAVKPIRGYLTRFSPVETPRSKAKNYALTYDIIHWHWPSGKRGTFANSVVGQVVIKHKAQNNHIMYDVNQRTAIGGVNNFVEAQITCNTDVLGSLRNWNLRSCELGLKGEPDPLSELIEKGMCRDERVRINCGNYRYEFEAENPIVTQWTVLDMLIRKASPQLDAKFDLLQDLSLYKPNQHLIYDGQTAVKCRDGQTMMDIYAQTGQGILPIHYLLDPQGRPQLVTSSILSWALSGHANIA